MVERKNEDVDELTETVRLGGLRSIIARNTSEQKEEGPVVSAPITTTQDLKTISREQAIDFFEQYAQKLVMQNRRSLSTYLADPIFEVNESEILFTVGSNNIALDIKEETGRILKYAAENGWLILAINVSVNAAQVSDYKVFTPKQQFDVLAKDFPILKDFEARFNLDFDA